jgi:hypothetical protein
MSINAAIAVSSLDFLWAFVALKLINEMKLMQ